MQITSKTTTFKTAVAIIRAIYPSYRHAQDTHLYAHLQKILFNQLTEKERLKNGVRLYQVSVEVAEFRQTEKIDKVYEIKTLGGTVIGYVGTVKQGVRVIRIVAKKAKTKGQGSP